MGYYKRYNKCRNKISNMDLKKGISIHVGIL